MEQLTDRQRQKKLAELLQSTRRKLMMERNQDIAWVTLSEEIGLGTPVSISQYQGGTRLPEGRNLIMLARWFRKEMDIDLYDYLGYPRGGPDDPRLEYIYDMLDGADEEVIRKIMEALKRNRNHDDQGGEKARPAQA